MSELKDRYAGRPAAVMGGGPSLPFDLRSIHELPLLVRIAVNYHALWIGEAVDFMVYNDDPESDEYLLRAVDSHQAVHVSPHKSSDVIFDVEVWTGFYSSNTAAWLGLWMGCDPVILCGMDCYVGSQKYCHPTDRDVPVFHYPLEDHLRPWMEDGRNRLPHVERLKAMSGPLGAVFGFYARGVS